MVYSYQIYFMEHHPVHHIKHHPDIRWIVVITVLFVGAGIAIFYNLFGLSKPVPQAVQQVEQQRQYLEQANDTIIQLKKINGDLQTEVKTQQQVISTLRAQIQVMSTTTKK